LESQPPRSPVPKSAKLIAGVLAFGSLTVVGFVALARWRPPAELGSVLERVSPGVLLLLLALLAVDFLLGGLLYRLFFDGRIFPHVSLWHCMRANWANMFLGAVTPAQTGGGPAQLYVLCRRGASLSDAVLVSLINLAATFLFFALGGLTALILLPPAILSRGASGVLAAAVASISVLAGLLIGAIVVQSRTMNLLRRFVTKLTWGSRRTRRWGAMARRFMTRELDGLRRRVRSIAARGKMTLGWLALATLFLYLNKYLMGFVLAVGLQGTVAPVFIGLQLLQNVVLYFAPTPGASGLAEVSSGILLNQVLAAEITVLWVVGWRLLTTYFATILGMFVLIAEARRHVLDDEGTEEKQAA
jgi:uncharacterized protein (TIRG00374 family)